MNTPASRELLLAACDREPVRFPGAVQAHGAMLAVVPVSGRITPASANLRRFLDVDAEQVLGEPLAGVLGDEAAAGLAAGAA